MHKMQRARAMRIVQPGYRWRGRRPGHCADAIIRELLERWLSEAGYSVVIRSAGEIQEACTPGDVPRLVIADVPLPRSAERLIKRLEDVYACPILIVSGRLRRDTSNEVARRLGVGRLLAKPFTRSELLAPVAQSMDAVDD